ncbi:MAG: CPBP family intramembrane metalloprotease [Myxococcales bacterium]|nr:CPBP family intramembrane metalloprotease [Myxococcales bacterium]
MVKLAIWFYAGMFVLACAITFFWGQGDFRPWFPWRGVDGLLFDIALGVGIGLAIVWLSRVGMERLAWGREMMRSFKQSLGRLRRSEVLLMAFLSGIAEEALFRMALQSLWGVWVASILFGLVHTGPKRHYMIWTLFAMAFGFLAGGLVLWRPGLLLPAVIHITVNAMNLAKISEESRQPAHPAASP